LLKICNRMESFNFQSQNLVVDWISFNIQGLTDSQIIDVN
jgi:hypothetical protein